MRTSQSTEGRADERGREEASAATEESSASAQQIAATAHELAGNARALSELVAQFKLTT